MGEPSILGRVYDLALIALVWWLALSFTSFLGGFGWFLLLGLSPRAWRARW